MFWQSPSYDDSFCMSPIWMMGNDRERKKFPGLSTNSLSLLLFSIILIWNEVIRIWFTCLIGIFNILWQKLLQVICQFNEIWTWFVLGAKTIYAKIVTCLFHFNSYCIVGLFYTGGNEFIPLPIVSFISL